MFSKDIQSTGRPYKEIEKRAIIFKEEEENSIILPNAI